MQQNEMYRETEYTPDPHHNHVIVCPCPLIMHLMTFQIKVIFCLVQDYALYFGLYFGLSSVSVIWAKKLKDNNKNFLLIEIIFYSLYLNFIMYHPDSFFQIVSVWKWSPQGKNHKVWNVRAKQKQHKAQKHIKSQKLGSEPLEGQQHNYVWNQTQSVRCESVSHK